MHRTVARHLAAAAAAAVVLATLVTIGAWRLAHEDAYHVAERVARQVAAAVLTPIAAHDLANPTTIDRADLNGRLAPFLTSRMIDRVKVFSVRDGHGTVVFSDEPRVERQTECLAAAALGVGQILVQPVPDDPSHRFENALAGNRVEVFLGFRDAGGNDASLELYVPVDDTGHRPGTTERVVLAVLPIVLAGLCVVTIALLPVSVAHARRAQRARDERHAAMRYGLAAAERARRDIARRLHDTVIPDLSAAGLLLERATTMPARTDLLTRVQHLVTTDVGQLRTLLTDLLPAADGDAVATLRDALARARAEFPDRDVAVDLTVDLAAPADPSTVGLLHQIATELVRNALRHANAGTVRVQLSTTEAGEPTLTVSDDGTGFDPTRAPAPGHVGLGLLAELVTDAGGQLSIDSRPGGGTVAVARLRAAPGGAETPGSRTGRWRRRHPS